MRRKRRAQLLAAMASDDLVQYEPNGDDHRDEYGTVWHGMKATSGERTWLYWLAADYGSYQGTHVPPTT